MNNYQWLLQMDGVDRKAWFDAEHVEHQEQVLDGDTESESINTDAVSERYATAFKWLDRLDYGKGGVIDNSLCDTPEQGEVVMPLESWREHLATESENEDSRDKLEADVRKIAEAYNMDTQRHGTERFEHELYYSIIHLLDRQAAITERECRKPNWDYCETCETLAELRTERRVEHAYWHNQMHAILDMLNGKERFWGACMEYPLDELTIPPSEVAQSLFQKRIDECDELRKQVDELTAERDKLQEQLRIGWECECRLQAERERYRSKFGKCLDYAEAIHALMDEVMA